MLSHALVCTMPSRICLRRPFFSSREQVKFKPRKSNGNWWLLLATEEWICSMRLLRFMKIFTMNILIILIASEDSFKLGKSLVCHINNSVRNSWFLTEKRRQREWWTQDTVSNNNSNNTVLVLIWDMEVLLEVAWELNNTKIKLCLLRITCQICQVLLHQPRPERWQLLHQSKMMMRMKDGEMQVLSLIDLICVFIFQINS